MKDWKLHLYYAFMVSLALAVPAYIIGFEWSRRACADPNAWQQKSFGRAIAECKALGGKPFSSDYDGTITCTKSTEVPAP